MRCKATLRTDAQPVEGHGEYVTDRLVQHARADCNSRNMYVLVKRLLSRPRHLPVRYHVRGLHDTLAKLIRTFELCARKVSISETFQPQGHAFCRARWRLNGQ